MSEALSGVFMFFFFNDTATTEIYTLSLHDALPISNYIRNIDGNNNAARDIPDGWRMMQWINDEIEARSPAKVDRKSTRLNSSHLVISYAVFCLKKKKTHSISLCAD